MVVNDNVLDRTNYAQSLMHMVKGNLGAGILAMPASFAHTGLLCGMLGLPLLCLICLYGCQVLVRSSQILERKYKNFEVNYYNVARKSFELGPTWLRGYSQSISYLVDTALLVTGVGILCIYIVFVVDNIISVSCPNMRHLTLRIKTLLLINSNISIQTHSDSRNIRL